MRLCQSGTSCARRRGKRKTPACTCAHMSTHSTVISQHALQCKEKQPNNGHVPARNRDEGMVWYHFLDESSYYLFSAQAESLIGRDMDAPQFCFNRPGLVKSPKTSTGKCLAKRSYNRGLIHAPALPSGRSKQAFPSALHCALCCL